MYEEEKSERKPWCLDPAVIFSWNVGGKGKHPSS
jgi:hypothetical protein